MLGDEQEESLTDFWCPLHPEALVANGLLHTFMVIRKLRERRKIVTWFRLFWCASVA